MSSLLERLKVAAIWMATPLLAVAATPKKSARPAPRRKLKPKPKTKAKPATAARTKSAARPAKPAPRVKTAPPKPARRAVSARVPTPEPPPAKPPVRRPEPPAPVKPTAPTGRAFLLLPENGKYAESAHPRFRWLSIGGAARYEIEWSEHADLSDSKSMTSVATEAAVPVETPLRSGATWYWRVRGGNDSGWGPWSPPSSFQVLETPPAP